MSRVPLPVISPYGNQRIVIKGLKLSGQLYHSAILLSMFSLDPAEQHSGDCPLERPPGDRSHTGDKRLTRGEVWANQFPSRNGSFPQSLRQSAESLVRRTMCTPPRCSLIALTLRKIAHFCIGNLICAQYRFSEKIATKSTKFINK